MTELERAQRRACERHGAAFSPPTSDQLCAVSLGVFEGDPVQGVRYQAPSHISGWYLTTERYNGHHTSLRVEHVAHLVNARPDIAQLLALPPVYRFSVGPRTEVWFDPAVAAQEG